MFIRAPHHNLLVNLPPGAAVESESCLIGESVCLALQCSPLTPGQKFLVFSGGAKTESSAHPAHPQDKLTTNIILN